VSDRDDKMAEALLGPDLTRKLDDHIAREAVRLHRPRLTRADGVRSAIGAVTGIAQMADQLREARQMAEVRKLRSQGLSASDIKKQLGIGRSAPRAGNKTARNRATG
jgi:hypothetical protein